MSLKSEQSTFRSLWRLLLRKERRDVVTLLSLIFVGMLLETLGVGMVVPTIALLTQDNFASKHGVLLPVMEALGNPTRTELVIGGMLVLVAVYLVKAIFMALLYWKQTRFAYDLQVRLSQRMFDVYMRQSYAFHLQRNSAKLINNVAGEIGNLISNAVLPGMILLTESLVLGGMCVMLLVVEPVGTLFVALILAVAAWSFHRVTRKHIAAWGEQRHHHDILRMQHLQQGLGGIKDVKLLGREAEFLRQYSRHNVRGAYVMRMQGVVQQLPRLWLELLAVSGLAILVISMLMQHRPIESVLPVLGLFAAAAFRLLPSVNRVLNSVQALRFGAHGIAKVTEEIELDVPALVADEKVQTVFASVVEMDHVAYSYEGSSKQALSDISLTVRNGESVGFIGHSGSGKSTLVDVFLGLLVPDQGAVRVDGQDIRNNLRNWQRQIGYVPQSIYLTDDTLRRNVAFGVPDDEIDDAAVARALRAAQLDEFIATLPDKLQTIVGERGVRLSGGQRQRIGIARALYHDPDVLVLDEATSSLDTETERGVMEAVKALKGEKTVLIVAHRLSTVAHCDRLYKFAAGKLLAQGHPDEMIQALDEPHSQASAQQN